MTPLPDCYALMTPEPTKEEVAKRKYFLSLVSSLNLPKHRVMNHDYEWILKYGPRHNPNCEKVFAAIQIILDQSRCSDSV